MRFAPVSPSRLVDELADRIFSHSPGRVRVGLDGFAETGVADIADQVAQVLTVRGRQVVRASTRWWWRAAALRLEFGRQDPDSLLTGWVDAAALNRELLEPLADGAAGRFLDRLRDPDTDRSVRRPYLSASESAIVLLDGPFLGAADLRLDLRIAFEVSIGTLRRGLPEERSWWAPVYERYRRDEHQRRRQLDIIVAFDHPTRPALASTID